MKRLKGMCSDLQQTIKLVYLFQNYRFPVSRSEYETSYYSQNGVKACKGLHTLFFKGTAGHFMRDLQKTASTRNWTRFETVRFMCEHADWEDTLAELDPV